MVPPVSIARSISGDNTSLASVKPTAKQIVGPLCAANAALSGEGRTIPDHEAAIGIMSDPGLRRMIEAWFELEKMKANLISGPDLAEMLKRCEERVRGAIMHLASETVTKNLAEAYRSGGPKAKRALWMEAVAQGEAETAAALAELSLRLRWSKQRFLSCALLRATFLDDTLD
jgi:hypothetical protein